MKFALIIVGGRSQVHRFGFTRYFLPRRILRGIVAKSEVGSIPDLNPGGSRFNPFELQGRACNRPGSRADSG